MNQGSGNTIALSALLRGLPTILQETIQVIGDREVTITGANPVRDAVAGDVTLIDSARNHDLLTNSQATAVVTTESIDGCLLVQLVTPKAHAVFEALVAQFRINYAAPSPGIHRLAFVDPTARIGTDCWIAEGASIGRGCHIGQRCRIHRGAHVMDGTHIGDDCELFPGVVVYPQTQIGNRVLIHAGSVLGAYGFGYRQQQGKHVRTAQLGYVVIEDDVEIGACTTIDRGTYGPTRIGSGTKIDNQVMIGHNCSIGRHNLICAQVGIAGSSSTGDYVVMGGQVGLRDHIHIGHRSMLAAQSGIANDIPEGETWMGSPAMPQKKYIQVTLMQARLPEMRTQLKQLKTAVAKLECELGLDQSASSGEEDERKAA